MLIRLMDEEKKKKNPNKPPGIGRNKKNINTVKSSLVSLTALKELRYLAVDED